MPPRVLVALLLASVAGVVPLAQTTPPKNPLLKLSDPWPDADRMAQRRSDAQSLRLFAADAPLPITLTVDLKKVDRDRNPNSKNVYPGELAVADVSGATHAIPLQINARGHLRRMLQVCEHVPLRLGMAQDKTRGTIFAGQGAMKLVVQCRNNNLSEQHLLLEYLAYRVANTITPRSFRARLAKVSYKDPNGKPIGERYGMLLEDGDDVAKRMEGRQVELPRAAFAQLDRETLDTMTLFNYMLGNTDYSIYALHNVVLVTTPSRTLFPVPYDFDVSGLVSPPYAIPDKRLPIRTVRERLYRGPCRTVEQFDATLGAFRSAKDRILGLPDAITDMTRGSRDDARKYINEFYDALKDRRGVKQQLVDRCVDAPTM